MKAFKKQTINKGIHYIIDIIIGLMFIINLENCSNRKAEISKELIELANEMNNNGPRMLDSATRFDTAIAMPHNILQITNAALNLEKKSFASIDTNKLKDNMAQRSSNSIKTNPGESYIRDNKISLLNIYIDKNGEYLFQYLVTPEMYKN